MVRAIVASTLLYDIHYNAVLALLIVHNSSSSDTNLKTLKTYGYTSSDLSLRNDRIEFTDSEIANGCSKILLQTTQYCAQLIESLGWQ